LSLTVIFYSYHTINPFTHSNIPINTDAQQFIALYGKTLVKTSPYGEKKYVTGHICAAPQLTRPHHLVLSR
jgi:hypothetical protein